mgnify:CR=1 FL=1
MESKLVKHKKIKVGDFLYLDDEIYEVKGVYHTWEVKSQSGYNDLDGKDYYLDQKIHRYKFEVTNICTGKVSITSWKEANQKIRLVTSKAIKLLYNRD